MVYKDLRDWLTDVEADGELRRLSGASPDLEMSSISEIMAHQGKGVIPDSGC